MERAFNSFHIYVRPENSYEGKCKKWNFYISCVCIESRNWALVTHSRIQFLIHQVRFITMPGDDRQHCNSVYTKH